MYHYEKRSEASNAIEVGGWSFAVFGRPFVCFSREQLFGEDWSQMRGYSVPVFAKSQVLLWPEAHVVVEYKQYN